MSTKMAATLLKTVRATNCLQTVARNVFPRVTSASILHCRQEKRQIHNCRNSAQLIAVQNGTCKLLCRFYSPKAMTVDDIKERVLTVCKGYDKVNAEKLTLESNFVNDLGLDSLDLVEVVMAIEDEFSFEIPDRDLDRLTTPGAIAEYICDKEEVYDE